MNDNRMRAITAPERIRLWCVKQFATEHVEKVFNDLLDVATGNRKGNPWEVRAVKIIFPEWSHPCTS